VRDLSRRLKSLVLTLGTCTLVLGGTATNSGCDGLEQTDSDSQCEDCDRDAFCEPSACEYVTDCRVCPDQWDERQATEEDLMVDLVNEARRSGLQCPSGFRPAVPELVADDKLRTAARLHALDMGENAYFEHDSLDGREPWDRMEDAGYTGFASGENIAAGSNNAIGTFEQWKNSDGHCLNMMDGDFNEIGVGYAQIDESPLTHYWVQNFGIRD
jgi:uncharacterized protein YkwD